jgi:hypothetical protein
MMLLLWIWDRSLGLGVDGGGCSGRCWEAERVRDMGVGINVVGGWNDGLGSLANEVEVVAVEETGILANLRLLKIWWRLVHARFSCFASFRSHHLQCLGCELTGEVLDTLHIAAYVNELCHLQT